MLLQIRSNRGSTLKFWYMQKGCSLVGLSVMTGNPIATSLKISSYIKTHYNTPIVWGGPHPTILPEQTLENKNIDYVIRDWGSKSLCQLIQHIKEDSRDIVSILGLGYKENDKIILNSTMCSFEMIDFQDLPYHLVNITGSNYNRLNNREIIFPVFTAVGCPYKCTFCMSPAVYKKIKGKKWIPYETAFVIAHIEYLIKKYDFQRLQIYDDDSFVDLNRMYNLLSEYVRNNDFLNLMVKANVDLLAIGVESGSDRILKKMNKGITVEQTIRVNQKIAKFSSLKPHYNFFCGVPGETMESLIETKALIIKLLKDNPNCYLGVGADWKPYPGSVMADKAVEEYGLSLPDNLLGWAAIDSFDADKLVHPWYTKEINNMIKLLQIAGQALDNKIKEFRKDMGLILGNFIYFLSVLYKPILLLRLKYNFTSFLLEYNLKNYLFHHIGKLMVRVKRISSIFKTR